jgi:hypothetical protein
MPVKKYTFYTINEPGKPGTQQAFNTIAAARTHAQRNAKKHRATYAIWGHVSAIREPEYLEYYAYSPMGGMSHYKMRSTTGKVLGGH